MKIELSVEEFENIVDAAEWVVVSKHPIFTESDLAALTKAVNRLKSEYWGTGRGHLTPEKESKNKEI